MQYWLGGSPDNIESMLLMLANTYVEDVKSTQSVISANIAEPVLLPDKGIWHPIAGQVRPLGHFQPPPLLSQSLLLEVGSC